MLYVLAGFLLIVLGVEAFLYWQNWLAIVAVLVGFGLAAFPEPRHHLALKSIGAVGFSLYFTATAFARYPGLAKDVEATFSNVALYFVRIAAVVAFALGALMFVRRLIRHGGDSRRCR